MLILLTFALPDFSMAQGFGGTPAPASVKWKQVNTERVRVIFPKGFDSLANRIANVARVLGDETSGTIGGKHNKWSILLQNQTTIPNAYVRMAPIVSEFYWTSDQNNFANGTLRWDDNLASHEYRHIQQFSNFNKGFTKVLYFLMGQEGQLLSTGLTIPDYFLEGDAVWQEMLVSSHGRSCLPSFYNGFKSLWLENKNYSWMKLRNGSFRDFVPNHYPLGYQLTAYGYENYGEDFWKKVTSDAIRYKGVFYPFNRAIERYSGKSYRNFRKDAMESFIEKTLHKETGPAPEFSFLTKEQKNNVVNYQFPNYINDDSLLVAKKSFKDVNSFCIISHGKEKKLVVRDMIIDDYYSFNGGKIVYAAYVSDPRWPVTRDYSVLKYVDIHSGKQKQLTKRSKYFSPDINKEGTEILAVHVAIEGVYHLCRIDASNGALKYRVPNPNNYFFTQTKYIDSTTAVSACKNQRGDMALVKVNLINGDVENLTPFAFGVIGYPFVKGDTVYFNASNQNADKIFAVSLKDNKIYRLTNNINGIYYPMVNTENDLFFSVFTAGGYRLAKLDRNNINWEEYPAERFTAGNNQYFTNPNLQMAGKGVLKQLNGDSETLDPGNLINYPVTKYKKSLHLFNFHSWRPMIEDPEYGYSIYSDNVLNTFKNTVYYSYNRSDFSHTIGFNSAFGGWFPVFSLGVEKSFDRRTDLVNSETYNAVTVHTGVSVPLQFLGGRTSQYLNFGGGYNLERAGEKKMKNKLLNYFNSFLSFRNVSQQAYQQINPRWAQSLNMELENGVRRGSGSKFVAQSQLFFPGLSKNHSLEIDLAYQKKDTTTDYYKKTFSNSRGYQAISTTRMYKMGVNYHFTLLYPDLGFANLMYIQRVRATLFFDYTFDRIISQELTIKNRSLGAEIYFDTKVWNSFPITFGLRYSYLKDRDFNNPWIKNRWEFFIPISFIPD
ncbi:MAG: hypothetical protein IPQ08_09610 [Chitinophagaceae bacterium]|nr:hypothetical protein [Chitinophagaceae bacterium]